MYILARSAVFLYVLVGAAISEPSNNEGGVSRRARGEEYLGAAMWFGPRLGKRALTLADDDEEALSRVLEAAETLKLYYSQLPEQGTDETDLRQSGHRIQFTPKLGRSAVRERVESVNFTPRLGRNAASPPPAHTSRYRTADQAESRPPLFSPRLGRTVHFSPRLGRDLFYEFSPPAEEGARVVRSERAATSA